MPGTDPKIGDIYLAHKSVFPLGDVHGDSPRRVGVAGVLSQLGIVHAFGRTTQKPRKGELVIESPEDESCGLSKAGWWNARYQQPVMLRHFGTTNCTFMGSLGADRRDELVQLYNTVRLLGL